MQYDKKRKKKHFNFNTDVNANINNNSNQYLMKRNLHIKNFALFLLSYQVLDQDFYNKK